MNKTQKNIQWLVLPLSMAIVVLAIAISLLMAPRQVGYSSILGYDP